MRSLAVLLFVPILTCFTGAPGEPDDDDEARPVYCPLQIGGDREAEVRCPEQWMDDESLPVIVLLHGRSASWDAQDLLWQISARVDEDRFALILPNGTLDEDNIRFWNATPACCDDFDSGVDDVGYLMSLVDQLSEDVPLDLNRVYFTGHSNGSFMSYRMACDRPDRVAAIAGLAGSTFNTPEECAVGDPVSVLHIHGVDDPDVPYEGRPGLYPGAVGAVERWAERAGCDVDAAEDVDPLDLTNQTDGAETDVRLYREGCDPGLDMALWTMNDTGHIFIPNDAYNVALIGWLLEHSLP